MARPVFMYPVKELHGKIDSEAVGFAQRGKTAYTVKYGERDLINHPVTQNETNARAKFTAVGAIARGKMTGVDKQVSLAQYQTSGFNGSFQKWAWAVAKAEYEAMQNAPGSGAGE